MVHVARWYVLLAFLLIAVYARMPSLHPLREGLDEDHAHGCGCGPWSELCVVPPRSAPTYGCIQPFGSAVTSCGKSPTPQDGHWLTWGFGHGHPLTAGHTEKETKKVATAVFGADSNLTRQLKNEAVRRDARARESSAGPVRPGSPGPYTVGGVYYDKRFPSSARPGDQPPPSARAKSGAQPFGQLHGPRSLGHHLAAHGNGPEPAPECGSTRRKQAQVRADTAKAVYADPVTMYTDMPVHLPTQQDLRPSQSSAEATCRPSVTGIFSVCGPAAAASGR